MSSLRLPQSMRESFPIPALWKRFLACFYGGIDEEILLRLFLLSLLARLIGLAWHLPASAAVVKLTPLLVVRAIVLNGIVGVAAGYLFWQYGLEAAMLAHFTGDIVLHIVGDSIAKSTRSRLVSAQG